MRTTGALLLALTMVLAGCGADGDAADDPPIDSDAGTEEVTEDTDAADAADDCDEQTIQLSFITAEDSTWGRAGARFGELLEEGTDGRLSVELFAGSQLAGGNQQAEVEQTQQGVIDAQWVSPIILALFVDPRFDIYSLPFLFPSTEVADTVIDGDVGQMTEEWVREGGLEPLGWGVNGFRQVTNSGQPITEPADMEGLQFRVAGTDLFIETFTLMGADPVTMDFGEVFTSLQQGVIDGQENPIDVIASSSLYEVQDHITLWDYAYDPLVLAMNADTFSSFCASDQELLSEAASEAGRYQREIAAEEQDELVAMLAEEGMEVVTSDEIDVDAFRELVEEPVWGAWEEVIGSAELDMMIQAVEDARG